MRPVVTDRVTWFVGRSVTVMSPAKTAQPIEMPFGMRTHVFDGVQIFIERGNFKGEGRPIVKYGTLCDELCKNG